VNDRKPFLIVGNHQRYMKYRTLFATAEKNEVTGFCFGHVYRTALIFLSP
jgi:hypothetical protein